MVNETVLCVAKDKIEAQMIVEMLKNEGIFAYYKNDSAQQMFEHINSDITQEQKIIVAAEDEEKARQLLETPEENKPSGKEGTFFYKTLSFDILSPLIVTIPVFLMLFNILSVDIYMIVFYLLIIIDILLTIIIEVKQLDMKAGKYRFDNYSLYITKGKKDFEIPVDMIDSLSSPVMGKRCYFRIKYGRQKIMLISEKKTKNAALTDFSVYPIIEEILALNPNLKQQESPNGRRENIWEYEE